MNYYEIVYVIHPALQAGHLDDIINQTNKKVEQLNGEILYFDNWGKKKLSYLIQKQKYGTYILFQCKIEGNTISELASDFDHNVNVLRHLITKITKNEILENKPTQDEKEKNARDVDKVKEGSISKEKVEEIDKLKEVIEEEGNNISEEIKEENEETVEKLPSDEEIAKQD